MLLSPAALLSAVAALASLAAATPAPAAPAAARRWLNFGYGLSEKVRGVNLGGWLVLEPYITPSLFQQFPDGQGPVDEYHFCQTLGKQACSDQLTAHWSTWFTADDFLQMSAAGLNHARLPVGYWAFALLDNDPYVQGQIPYLEQALQWARQANIKIWIDIHGLPGSQNGFDNSGLRDSVSWTSDDLNYEFSKSVLATAIATYSAPEWNDVVVAIQPVNEPLASNGFVDINKVKEFYNYGYDVLRNDGQSDIVLAIHDAFMGMPYWNGYMSYPDYYNVILDHHSYQVFSQGELQYSMDQHIATACQDGANARASSLWVVVGEWSAALTDCVCLLFLISFFYYSVLLKDSS